MDALLGLGVPLEAEFWNWDLNQPLQHIIDQVGLSLCCLINALGFFLNARPGIRYSSGLTLALTLLQLAWASSRSRSYRQWRFRLTLLQRLRVCVISTLAMFLTPSDRLFQRLESLSWFTPGSWRAMSFVVGFITVPPMLTALYFPLPFKHQLMFTIYTVILYVYRALPRQLDALAIYKLEPLFQPGCVSSAAGTLSIDHTSRVCNRISPSFFLAYIFLLMVALLPLQLAWFHELNAKLTFLRMRRISMDSVRAHIAGVIPTSMSLCLLYAWIWCVITWVGLGILQASLSAAGLTY